MKGAGSSFPMSDVNLLKLTSPKAHLEGPFRVVYKNSDSRWALVAIKWDDIPGLGVRWFHRNHGQPVTIGGHGTWFVIPNELSFIALQHLQINPYLHKITKEFLQKQISGYELKVGFKKNDVVLYGNIEYIVEEVTNNECVLQDKITKATISISHQCAISNVIIIKSM